MTVPKQKDYCKYKGIHHLGWSAFLCCGFRRLIEHTEPCYTVPSKHFFWDVCLPDIYNITANHFNKLQPTDILAPSFTADTCCPNQSNSKMDWHWFQAVEFKGPHTAVTISEVLANKCMQWSMGNARNTATAMWVSHLKSIRCMAHTCHLVVNKGVFSQCSNSKFKHSPLAYLHLQILQV